MGRSAKGNYLEAEMAFEKRSRLEFLQVTAVGAAVVAAGAGAPGPAVAAAGTTDLSGRWLTTPDRVWLGAEYWANPLQDWRVVGGRIECINAAPNRNVHLLTRQLAEQPGDLKMSVKIGRVGDTKLSEGKGSAGFRIGIMGPLRDYRNSLIYGQGLDAGFTSDGKLFIGEPASSVAVDLSAASVELRLTIESHGEMSTLTVAAFNVDGKELARVSRDNIASMSLAGNLALVANFGAGGAAGGGQKAKKAKAKGGEGAGDVSAGQFWFADWKLSGSRLETHEDRAFGPILFSQFTVNGGVLKLTAQMPPLGVGDSRFVRLEVQRDGNWTKIAEAPIHPVARTATLRVEKWDDQRDAVYRLAYTLKQADGASS